MMKNDKYRSTKKYFMYFIIILMILALSVLIYRLLSSREIDDVTPGIKCDYELIEKSDILWVIPIFENKSIADDRAFCDYISNLNKTLGMHGVYHTYREFGEVRDKEYINNGIKEFEKCFGYKPKMFKAPQMYFNEDNEKTLNDLGLSVRGKISQIFHKAYHCSDSGVLSNRFMDWI